MFREFLKKILKNLNSLKKSLKLFKIPIFKDNSLKMRALVAMTTTLDTSCSENTMVLSAGRGFLHVCIF
jgi:hypothetical protein